MVGGGEKFLYPLKRLEHPHTHPSFSFSFISRLMKRWKAGGFSRQVREEASALAEAEAEAAAAPFPKRKKKRRAVVVKEADNLGTLSEHQTTVFGSVLAACAGVNEFWAVLEVIREVGKMACVCKETRALLQPTERVLPFWSSWIFCFRMHTWKEMHIVMNVKKNDQGRIRNPNLVDPFRKSSARCWDLADVWSYMMEKHGGTMEGYAAALHKYRKHRLIHFRRQVSHLCKIVEAVGEEEQERKEQEQEEEDRRAWRAADAEERRQALFERE